MPRLILASASPARARTLRSAGIEPTILPSNVDEPALIAQHPEASPADVALVLARAKCEAIASGGQVGSDAVVVACDSVLNVDGRPLGKPASEAEAVQRWHAMRGRTGMLHTGHWLIDCRSGVPGASWGAVASTTVEFASPSDEEVAAYCATGEPLHVAGAFTVDGLGGAFVRSIEGDYHNVVGISLPLLRELLLEAGVSWPELWAKKPQ